MLMPPMAGSQALASVKLHEFVKLFCRELVQFHYSCAGPVNRRKDRSDLLFVISFDNDPSSVYPVLTSEISLSQVMRASSKQNLDGGDTSHRFRVVVYFHEKPVHQSILLFCCCPDGQFNNAKI
jgi:hypothetical protein